MAKLSNQEITLVRKASRGNVKAFETLIKENSEYLYKVAVSYLRNEDNAYDAVQEAIIKAYLNIKSLKKAENFRTWITRIVINACYDIIRSVGADISLDDDSTFINEIADIPKDYESMIDLYSSLHNLPEKYKSVIELKYFAGYSIVEIAELLGIPQGTVSTNLSRGKTMLYEMLKTEI